MTLRIHRRWPALVAAFVALLSAAAPARADPIDDRPVATLVDGVPYVAETIRGRVVINSRLPGGEWTGWVPIGGTVTPTSGPAISSRPGAIDVFVRSDDNSIVQSSFVDGRWTEWASIGGCARSAPSSLTRHDDHGVFASVDIFVRGCDDRVWAASWSPATGQWAWSDWHLLDAGEWDPDIWDPVTGYQKAFYVRSAPTAVEVLAGTYLVYAISDNAHVFQKAWMSHSFSGWYRVSDELAITAPSAIKVDTAPTVYQRVASNQIVENHWDGSGWTYTELGAEGVSAPAAVRDPDGNVLLFTRGSSSTSVRTFQAAPTPEWGPWTTWTDDFAEPAPLPPAPLTPAPATPGATLPSVPLSTCTDGKTRFPTAAGRRCADPPVAPFVTSAMARGHRVIGLVVSPTSKGQTVEVRCHAKCAKSSPVLRVKGRKRQTSIRTDELGVRRHMVLDVRVLRAGRTTRYVRYTVGQYPYLSRLESGCQVERLTASC